MAKSVIVVLSGGVKEDDTLSESSKARVRKGIDVFRKDESQHIIMSGRDSFRLKNNPRKSEASMMKEYAISFGVPSRQIIVEDHSLDTAGNVYFTDQIISRMQGVRLLTLVTDQLHMKRASYFFRKMFQGRFELHFVQCRSPLSKERIKVLRAREKETLAFSKKIYGGIKNGRHLLFRRMIKKEHPLYARNLDEIPGIVWRQWEKRGFTIKKVEQTKAKIGKWSD